MYARARSRRSDGCFVGANGELRRVQMIQSRVIAFTTFVRQARDGTGRTDVRKQDFAMGKPFWAGYLETSERRRKRWYKTAEIRDQKALHLPDRQFPMCRERNEGIGVDAVVRCAPRRPHAEVCVCVSVKTKYANARNIQEAGKEKR